MGWGWGGRLFEVGRLLTFSAIRMGTYSRWALIRGWALIRINTVVRKSTLRLGKASSLKSIGPILNEIQVFKNLKIH